MRNKKIYTISIKPEIWETLKIIVFNEKTKMSKKIEELIINYINNKQNGL